ncbi:MAG TPA: transporter substrate-binding domain-containing protein [Myxococcales bacterium]
MKSLPLLRAGLGAALLAVPLAAMAAAPAATPAGTESEVAAAYVLKGDLKEMQAKKAIRFLVRGSPDMMPRAGDPRFAEQALAQAFADKLNLTPVLVPVSSLDEMVTDLNEGRGDVVAASLTVTPAREKKLAFTRAIRFVNQVVVVKADDASLKAVEDLAGKAVTVRPTSSYADLLAEISKKVKGIDVRAAAEDEDTVALIQKVGRGEILATVADEDILKGVLGFEPNVKAAFVLAEKTPIAWGVRRSSTELKSALDSFLIEKAMSEHKDHVYKSDLDDIKKRGVLRVLTRNSNTCYFLYRGEDLGFEYELAREFAKEQGLRLEVALPESREQLFTWLAEGRGDLSAAGLTATAERAKAFAFGEPYNEVSEVLVVSAKDKATKGLADLKGKKISVRRSSSYYQSLLPLQEKYGFEIDLVSEEMETEQILKEVGEGRLTATIADSNILEVELTYDDDVRGAGPLGDTVKIAWALRQDQPQLKAAVDAFFKKHRGDLFFNMTRNKYFKNPKYMRASGDEQRSDKEGRLSPFDALVKKYSRQYEFDWRLITAQMYQESHFDPTVKSWVGAQGLLQVMPATAKELKIENVTEPEAGVHAGVKLLSRYARLFMSPEVKEKDRMRFALAAYNCGPGHVHDARRLAADLKLNPNKWFGNVEKAMLLLSVPQHAKKARSGYCRCEEPVKYVSSIQSRYDNYSRLAKLE